VADRGAIRAAEILVQSGADAEEAVRRGAVRLEGWLASPELVEEVGGRLVEHLGQYHRAHPLRPGVEVGEARALLAEASGRFSDPGLADALISHLANGGGVVREGTTVRLATHRASTVGRQDADRLVEAVVSAEPTPPSVKELIARGFGPELIQATCSDGRLVRISPDVVVSPALLARAEAIVRGSSDPQGITVSQFREALATSRKYALPILEYFDSRGVTRRQGDYRVVRS
jgi:selenocysteine-specific elongation factor